MTEQINKFLVNFLMYILLFLIMYIMQTSSLLLILFIVLCFVPTTYFAATYKANHYILAFICMAISCYLLNFSFSTLYFLIIIWVIGYFLSYSFMQRQSKMKIYIEMVVLINILIIIGQLIWKICGHDVNIASMLNHQLINQYQIALDKKLLVQSDFDLLIEQVHFMVKLTPSFIFLGLAIISLISLNVTCQILKQLKIIIPRFFPFNVYNIPRVFVIIFMGTILLNMVFSTSYPILATLLLNLILILTVVAMLQGISFLFDVITKYNMPIFVKPIVVIFSLFFINYIAILGIGDIIFKLKEKIKK